jgi:hypothetical protein
MVMGAMGPKTNTDCALESHQQFTHLTDGKSHDRKILPWVPPGAKPRMTARENHEEITSPDQDHEL